MTISCGIHLRMRNVSDKLCRKKTHCVFNNFFFLNSCFYEIMWKNVVHTGHVWHNVICSIRSACLINKAKTHTLNMSYILLSCSNSIYAETPQYCVLLTFLLSFFLLLRHWLKFSRCNECHGDIS